MNPVVTISTHKGLNLALIIAAFLFSQNAFAQPTPAITGESTPCQNGEYTYSTPLVAGSTWLWSTSPGGSIVQTNGNSVVVEWTGNMNSDQWVMVSETDAANVSASDQLAVAIANSVLSCENNVNVSIDLNGTATITPQMLLDGNYSGYGNFSVELTSPNGTSYGDVLTCANIGQSITGRVTDVCTGNSCWSNINLEDKKAPVWDCPPNAVIIECDTDIDTLPHPLVTDNCDTDVFVTLTGIQIDNSDVCMGVSITRHWIANDDYGNESYCTQLLQILPAQDLRFPDDRVWLCDQYNLYPNITEPTAYTGDPLTSGSGIPLGAQGPYCPYSYVSHDDTVSACGNTFKIVRTWTVLNWCTQQVVTQDQYGNDSEQLIKIADFTKPLITAQTVELSITEPGASAITCRSQDFIPAPVVTDNCNEVTVQIFTAVGEAEYVNGVDGSEGGFVPSPGLGIGQHTITYKATDACGNTNELLVYGNVVDDEAPIAVCDEITSVSLDQFGNSLVYAETFDDGSFDNCCIGDMQVKRMGQPDLFFGPAVPFDCLDEGSDVQVVFRVFDCFGNYSECMVIAQVEDKLSPSCVAPQQKIIPCTELPPDIDQDYVESFGEALAFDNCNASITEAPFAVNINSCGEGHIIRFFSAIDDAGNQSQGTCEQHIYFTSESDWLISFPPNWYGECGDSIDAIEIVFGEFACENLVYSVSDQFFAISNDSACFKIVRTWEVINWCTYDPNLDPIVIPNNEFGVSVDEEDYNDFGHYTYQQIVMITDSIPPVLSAPFDYEFCRGDTSCSGGEVFLPIQIDGECTTDIDVVYFIDLNKDGSNDLNGTGIFEGFIPNGTHSIRYLVEDGCRNEADIVFDFEVKDCKKPSPVCKDGLVVEIMQTGMVEVCADDLLEYADDNCPGILKISFSPDVSDVCHTLECSELGQNAVQIWATDEAGNADYCDSRIILQDNMQVCNNGLPISGLIATNQNDPVGGVNVLLNNTDMNEDYTTSETGMFEFMDLPVGNDYSITPEKDDDYLNGVTTFDLVMISRHILGVQLLGSPYQLIAADVNNSQSVTTFDLVGLRKLILHVDEEFPNNTSWRFVQKSYAFPNPNNPWEEAFPEVINVNNFNSAISDADFVAVKIGDVNNSVNASGNLNGSTEDRGNGMLEFETENDWLEAGETVPVIFRAKDFANVYGFQFTIDFDASALEFNSIVSTSLTNAENYGLSLLEQGAVTALWFETTPTVLADGEAVLHLLFKVKTPCYISDAINISSRYTTAEAYVGEDMETWDVDLQFGGGTTATKEAGLQGFALYQNIPNPFAQKTTIGFDLPNAATAKFSIYDTNGRIILETEDKYPSGYNEITINRKALPTNSLLFYKIEAEGMKAVRQMTLIND